MAARPASGGPRDVVPTGSPDPERLRSALGEAARRSGVAGAQLSVHTPHSRIDLAWGHAAPDVPLRPTDRPQVGSIAKVLTAVLVHQLVDHGLLDLDTDVAAISPELPAGVGVAQLLSMTSGLDSGLWSAGDSVAEALAPQLLLPRRSGPGTFGYSGVSTLVAARVVELLRGGPWWSQVLERVGGPLGLALTDVPDVLGMEPDGEGHWTSGTAPPLVGMGPTGTTLCASAADLAALAIALADPDGPLLSPTSHAALHRRAVDVGAVMCADGWCHGPYVRRAGPVELHGHGGRWTGGVSDLTWSVDSRSAVAIVTTTPSRGGDLVRRLSRAVHPLLWGEAAYVEPADLHGSTEDLDALVGDFRTATRAYRVSRRGDRLELDARSLPHSEAVFALPDSRTELVPVGSRRFMPAEETRDERRLQEVWFSGESRPEHCYDGFVAARRARASATTAASASGS